MVFDEKTVGAIRDQKYYYIYENAVDVDNSIYCFDATTDENYLIYQNTDASRYCSYLNSTEKYLLLYARGTGENRASFDYFILYDIKTQMETKIPY